MTIVLPVRQRTPEWLAARENGIGASQAAAAIGVSEWQSMTSLWAEKLKLIPPQPQNLVMEIGQELEPLIARKYTELTGVKIRRATQLRQHGQHPFMLASLDRRAGRKPIELKYSTRAVGYGEPGTDEVPDDVLVQVLHQLLVLDEPEGDVALLKPGAETVLLYRVTLTVEAAAAIVEREATFWDHVQSRTEPPLDGSESTHRALAAMYPRGADENVIEADDELAAVLRNLRETRLQIQHGEAWRAELEARIKAAMLAEKATVVRAAGVGQIPWRATKPRETTDWRAVADAYREMIERVYADAERGDIATVPFRLAGVPYEPVTLEDLDTLVGIHTNAKETAPRFGPPKWDQEED